MSALPAEEVTLRLAQLPGWRIDTGELVKTFTFSDFRAALRFVNQVGELAEAAGHHPDIDIRYNRVRLSLITHDAKGLTRKISVWPRRLTNRSEMQPTSKPRGHPDRSARGLRKSQNVDFRRFLHFCREFSPAFGAPSCGCRTLPAS